MIDSIRPPQHVGSEPCCTEGCACGVEPLAHPKYSFGMLLEARHLALEHRYHATRMNTHDIRLHDFGTVCGLRVDRHPAADCVNRYVILRPGIALDCCGREIVVPEDVYVPLYAGATSGWCGAPAALQSQPPTSGPRTKLYVYLRYQQCDTDPVPMYVRNCGCCADACEHAGCVPSVTREGYEISVSTTPPVPWRNPAGAAFCAWLDAQLKGPGVSANAHVLVDRTLEQALCAVVTEPCIDVCAIGSNDELLLATIAFDANDNLQSIDNCTDRRIVVSTGALFEAMTCLTTAAIACCGSKSAYLALAASVVPATVNLEAPPTGNVLTYTATVTNADASAAADAFALTLALPPEATFVTATFTIDGAAQPPPAGGTSVSAPVPALAAGTSAQIVVTATFDPAVRHAGDTITGSAAIAAYGGGSDAAIPLPTTFSDVRVDGPRVVYANLPKTLSVADLTGLLRNGLPLPFSEAMAPASAVVSSTAGVGDVFLELVQDGTAGALPVAAAWSNGNALLTLSYDVQQTTFDPIGVLVQSIESKPSANWAARVRLLGNVKGTGTVTGPALTSATGQRLDGDPALGGPPGAVAGESGDGTQGGDFIWTMPIVVAVTDGPHVQWKQSQLPTKSTFQDAFARMLDTGYNFTFDAAMNTTLPSTGTLSSSIVTITIGGKSVAAVVRWQNAKTLNVHGGAGSREALDVLAKSGGPIVFTLAGGPKGDGPSPTPSMQGTDATRLDGDPPNGSGTFAANGLSGDGRQGGDFTWTISVEKQ